MPISPELGRQLADVGGMALFLLLLVAVGIGLLRQWWVPGWLYRAVVAELIDARAENKELRQTVSRLTTQLTRERRHRASDE